MKIIFEYSQYGGSEILQVRYSHINHEINSVIDSLKAQNHKINKESLNKSTELKDVSSVKDQFAERFRELGFEELIDYYQKIYPDYVVQSLNEKDEADFIKDRVFVEIHYDLNAFWFYDLEKFQYYFNERRVDVGVEIVPCQNYPAIMLSTDSFREQLNDDIKRLKCHFPAVSEKIIFIDVNDDQEI